LAIVTNHATSYCRISVHLILLLQTMEIKVLAFGIVKEIFSNSSVTVALTEGATVSELTLVLAEKYPAIKNLSSFAVTINGRYGAADELINAGDEIAIIPPVSGG
jgi:molybdopterin converting factor small subunit